MRKKENAQDKKSVTWNQAKLKQYFTQKTFIGILLTGALVLVMTYTFVYLDYMQKTQDKEASNTQLRATVAQLENYYHNMADYISQTQEMETAVEEILAEYPADAREEDVVMLAVQLQNYHAISYQSINMEEPQGVSTVGYDVVAASGMEGLTQDIVFTQKHATYANRTDYKNLKECIREIYNSPNRIGIDSIVYVKDEESAVLEGNINLYFYSAAGTGKEYEAPDIAEYLEGLDDLFRSDKVVISNESQVDVEEDDERDETP